jgi:hypothetical protein
MSRTSSVMIFVVCCDIFTTNNLEIMNDELSVIDDTPTELCEDYQSLTTLPGLRAIDNWTLDADEGVCILFNNR